jgi:AraC family transcriptional regulator, alkane utilization regulator
MFASFDVLSDVLRVVRLSGAVMFHGDFSAPWAVITAPAEQLTPMVLPGAKQLMPFHIVEEGTCWIELEGHAPLELQRGDIVVLPYCTVHKLASDRGMAPMPCLQLLQANEPTGQLPRLVHGGGGAPTRLVCGFVYCEDLLFNPMYRALPVLIHVEAARERTMSLLAATVEHTISETETARPGSECLLARLSELLFVEVLRHHIAEFSPGAVGWLGALKDPVVGRALQLLHASPCHSWTVATLSRRVGVCRSVLADRFKLLLGQPPMQYLTCWRLQLAAQMLRSGGDGVSQIAGRVGYSSEAAFNRAFKRYAGRPPATWRLKEALVAPAETGKAAYRGSRRGGVRAQKA